MPEGLRGESYTQLPRDEALGVRCEETASMYRV